MTYQQARDKAQSQANATGFDFGVEQLGGEYRAFMLPARQNRFGHELRCEVVMCENLDKCRKGHGPC